jgi:hypothetical protein
MFRFTLSFRPLGRPERGRFERLATPSRHSASYFLTCDAPLEYESPYFLAVAAAAPRVLLPPAA